MKIIFVSAQLDNVIESSPSLKVTLKPFNLEYCGLDMCTSFTASSTDDAAHKLYDYFYEGDRKLPDYKVVFDSPVKLIKEDDDVRESVNTEAHTGLLKQRFYQLVITKALVSTSNVAQKIGQALKSVGENIQSKITKEN